MTVAEVLKLYKTPSAHLHVSILERQITGISFDSRNIKTGSVFVAVRGEKSDGHKFLTEVVDAGAIALIVENKNFVPQGFDGAVLVVSNTREALGKLASHYYGRAAMKLFCVGVTGTNGKTTVSYMTEAVFNDSGGVAGVIGTIDHHVKEKVWATQLTTPDPLAFHQRLSEMKNFGATAVILEVSSHALRQHRVDEVDFDVAVFTHLTRDHLDYHGDLEDYFDAKSRLFTDLLPRSLKSSKIAIINGDDPFGRRLLAGRSSNAWSYGVSPGLDLQFQVLEEGFSGSRSSLHTPVGDCEVSLRIPGLHNVYNAVAALGVGLSAGLDLMTCVGALAKFVGVKGRLEAIPNDRGIHIFVDYAHTDDALKVVLRGLDSIRKKTNSRVKIISLFGCGGDRDKGKRPLMMRSALQGSDKVVVTSDNPRTEDPEDIIEDILAEVDRSKIGRTVFREPDRRQAIALALSLAQPGDVVLVAGKGHEEYQQVGNQKHFFSDVEVVESILGRRKE